MNRVLSFFLAAALLWGAASVLPPGAKPTNLGSVGAGEGPAWDGRGNLYFTNEHRITRRDSSGQVHTFRDPSNDANGLLFDPQGRLMICESGARRVTRIEPDGKTVVLADRYQGMRFNSPNDLTIDSKGRIYFSDPRYGPRDTLEMRDEKHHTVEGVYRIDGPGIVTRVIGHEVDRANGVLVSPHDQYLYVADNDNNNLGAPRKLWRFDLRGDGTIEPNSRKLIFDWKKGRGPDGVKMDREGRLYVAAGLNKPNPPYETADFKGGIYVLSPEGKLLEFIPIPVDEVTNCAFGGPDWKTLFITAGGTLWSIPVSTPGWTPLSAAAPHADLILHHGRILTVDQAFSIQSAVSIRNGRFSAVGSNDAVLSSERGPNTRLVDLHGLTVVPGLIDAHVHALEAGLSEFRGPLPRLTSFSDIQDYLRAQMRTTPKGQWIVVPRTFPTRLKEQRMPTRELLDIATEHPVLFDASYVVIVNSYALNMSGITDAPDGILRNAQGRLKGLVRPRFSEQEKLDALAGQLQRYAEAGLTSVGDRKVETEEIGLYRKLYAGHRLPIRVAMTWWVDINRPEADLLRDIRAFPGKTNDGDHWLRFQAFKVNVDGGMTIGTAYQRQPYGPFGQQLYGNPDPNNRGQLFAPPAKLLNVMRTAREQGWQLTAHSQGGGAVDAFLDALDALNSEKPLAPTRSHLIHASLQSREALARAKRIGILADVQAAWLYLDGPALEKVFGYDGMRFFYPLRAYLDDGIRIAAGSDHMIGHDRNTAVNPYNPFLSMWIAITRQTREGKVIYPDQKITRAEALKMHTIWPSYLQFEEDAKGSIEPGKLADLVVLDRDYLNCPENEIRQIRPLATLIEGQAVYHDPSFQIPH